MKHTRSLMSVTMATIMLLSLCAVVSTTSVSAATVSENAITSKLVSTSVSTSQSSATVQSGLVGGSTGILGTPAVCSQDANSLDLFVQGTDNALWHRHWTSTTGWSAWKSLGGQLTAGPAATLFLAGDMAVFVRGTNGALYMKASSDGGNIWSGWGNDGGQILDGTGPGASRWGSDGFAIFVTGTNHQVYLKSWTSSYGWVDWRSIGGYVTSSPGAASLGTSGNSVVVAARGTNGALYYKGTGDLGDIWSDWGSWGGQILDGTGPAITTLPVFFVTGTNHQLYYNAGTWTSLGGYLTSGPAVTQRSASTGDIFVRGKDGAIYWKACDSACHDWIRLSGPPG